MKSNNNLQTISIISPQYGTVGTDINYYKIAKQLSNQGHIIKLLIIGDEWKEVENNSSIEKINLIPKSVFNFLKIFNKLNWKITMILACVLAIIPFIGFIYKNKKSHYLLGLVPIFPMIIFVLFNIRSKVIFSIQGLPKSNVFSLNIIISKLVKNIRYVIPHEGMKTYIKNNYNFSNLKNLSVIENAVLDKSIIDLSKEKVDENIFRDKNKTILIGVGRLTRQKNFDMLIRAFYKLNKDKPDTRLVILGNGEEKSKLLKLTESLKLIEKVHFFGHVKNPFKYMKSSDLFIMSSRWEGPGHVLIEALGIGCPVITTDCPSGPKETIQNGKFGLIVENDNDQELYLAMNHALNNKDTMKKKVNESKAYMKRFYTEQVAEKYLNLFIN